MYNNGPRDPRRLCDMVTNGKLRVFSNITFYRTHFLYGRNILVHLTEPIHFIILEIKLRPHGDRTPAR